MWNVVERQKAAVAASPIRTEWRARARRARSGPSRTSTSSSIARAATPPARRCPSRASRTRRRGRSDRLPALAGGQPRRAAEVMQPVRPDRLRQRCVARFSSSRWKRLDSLSVRPEVVPPDARARAHVDPRLVERRPDADRHVVREAEDPCAPRPSMRPAPCGPSAACCHGWSTRDWSQPAARAAWPPLATGRGSALQVGVGGPLLLRRRGPEPGGISPLRPSTAARDRPNEGGSARSVATSVDRRKPQGQRAEPDGGPATRTARTSPRTASLRPGPPCRQMVAKRRWRRRRRGRRRQGRANRRRRR